MKVYLEEKDIGRRITTYHDGLGTQQGLYVFGKDKIEVHSLADYTKQVRKEVVQEIRELTKDYFYEMLDSEKIILERDFIKVLDQIQGEKE